MRKLSKLLLIVALLIPAAALASSKDKVVTSKHSRIAPTAPSLDSLPGKIVNDTTTSANSPVQGLFRTPSSTRQTKTQLNADNSPRVHRQKRRGITAVTTSNARQRLANRNSRETSKSLTMRYLRNHNTLFGLRDPNQTLTLKRTQSDRLGMKHQLFQQSHNGVSFWGRQLIAHYANDGNLAAINCLIQQDDTASYPDANPTITREHALAIVSNELIFITAATPLTEADYDKYKLPRPVAKIYYWQQEVDSEIHLAWIVEIPSSLRDRWRYFIDAHDGSVLQYYNITCHYQHATAQANTLYAGSVIINTTKIDNQYYLLDTTRDMFDTSQSDDDLTNDPQGTIVTWDLRGKNLNKNSTIYDITSTNNSWSDAAAVSAHYFAGLSYDYWLNEHGRNSFDDEGSTIITMIHVTESGQPMDNAYWNGQAVVLGDGDDYFYSLAGALDVAAHELTHAVVEYTAALEYAYDSGALNETYADVFGVMIDDDDYMLGEDIIKDTTTFPTGALRDMANPHNGGTSYYDSCWQPSHMDEYMDLPLNDDNGGVHINGGITNHAAYLMMEAIGRQATGKIWYRALNNYLVKQSNFTDARIAMLQAAADLYGEDSTEQQAVATAYDAVGITDDDSSSSEPDEVVTLSGDEFILLVNNNPMTHDHSLYYTTPEFEDFEQLSYRQINTDSGRPIAVDAYGERIFFIDSNYNLCLIDESGETVIDGTDHWFSVAVSPSGNRIALTRDYDENLIYILDLQTNQTDTLTLLHPTTTQGQYEDIVRFADVMVWVDEKYLIYDCYKSIDSPGTGTIDFWDVNKIDTDTGQVYSIMATQDSSISIGNPVLSPKHPSLLCIDMIDYTASVLAVNLYTGKSTTLFSNGSEPAYPDYAPDGQSLIFQREGARNSSTIYSITLTDDGQSTAGTAEALVSNAMLPVWYVVGSASDIIVQFSLASGSGAESTPEIQIPVILSEISVSDIAVDYTVSGGTATGSGTDYTLADGTITFAAGEQTQYITLGITDDELDEDGETVIITLSDPTNAQLGSTTTYTYTILDDDTDSGGNENPIVYHEVDLTIDKTRFKADRDRDDNGDSFKVQGSNFAITTDDLAAAETIAITLYNAATEIVWQRDLTYNAENLDDGQYEIEDEYDGTCQFAFDMEDNVFILNADDIDLTGLTGPATLEIVVGLFYGTAQIDEQFSIYYLNGYADTLSVTKSKVKYSDKDSRDSLSIQGEITPAQLDTDLTESTVTLTWDTFTAQMAAADFTASGRKFKYKRPKDSDTPVKSAQFDFDKCQYKIKIDHTDLPELNETEPVNIQFANFNQSASLN